MTVTHENRRVRQRERELGHDGRCPKLSSPARKPAGVRYEIVEVDDPVVDGVIIEIKGE